MENRYIRVVEGTFTEEGDEVLSYDLVTWLPILPNIMVSPSIPPIRRKDKDNE